MEESNSKREFVREDKPRHPFHGEKEYTTAH